MLHRARLSKLDSWVIGSPAGSRFLGSKDFPPGLVEAIEKYDPAGLLLGPVSLRTDATYDAEPSERERKRLKSLLIDLLQGKRILNLAGGSDKMVPYQCAEPFLRWLKHATAPDGWCGGSIAIRDIVFDGVGHEMSPGMAKEAVQFVAESLEAFTTAGIARSSKI